jgi:hypothetical protein
MMGGIGDGKRWIGVGLLMVARIGLKGTGLADDPSEREGGEFHGLCLFSGGSVEADGQGSRQRSEGRGRNVTCRYPLDHDTWER